MLIHRALPSFWRCYASLAPALQERARKQFEILETLPSHPSLQLKPVGEFWSARVTDAYRALAWRDGSEFHWFWIGTHDEYERLVAG